MNAESSSKSSAAQYGPAISSLLVADGFRELGPGRPNQDMLPQLESLRPEDLFAGQGIAHRQLANCCLSALWLYHDFLDRSHEISQGIDTSEGSYWHAIMHRREGDFSNSKYWLRRVGEHPVYEKLASAAPADAAGLVANGRWDPYAFVDLCQAAVRGRTEVVSLCQQLQQAEWRLLFDYCYRGACQS